MHLQAGIDDAMASWPISQVPAGCQVVEAVRLTKDSRSASLRRCAPGATSSEWLR
ncbi:hypothetical protein JOD69_002333 [Methylocaldum sp. RMAD-M]|nr:hypothetical protein [Methylocaldum sp. RMAD-M]